MLLLQPLSFAYNMALSFPQFLCTYMYINCSRCHHNFNCSSSLNLTRRLGPPTPDLCGRMV